MSNKKVYVIVVTWNGMPWIEKCVTSLLQSSMPLKILVVDNQSTDGTVPLVQKTFPGIQVIEAGQNLGFGKANNIGLKKALDENADYVFLLNQDAWIGKDTIEKLIAVAEKHPEFGIISPFHMNYDGTQLERYFKDFVLKEYTPEYKFGSSNIIYESAFVHAAGWLIPELTLREVGGFDPLYTHTGEDNDYVQRLHFKNKKIGIVSSTFLFHQGTNEGLVEPKYNYNLKLNKVFLNLKNPNASSIGALFLFCKHIFIGVLRSISKRDFGGFKLTIRILSHVILNLRKIFNSRKEQLEKHSFLKFVVA